MSSLGLALNQQSPGSISASEPDLPGNQRIVRVVAPIANIFANKRVIPALSQNPFVWDKKQKYINLRILLDEA
jgi:hypothetical protein